MPERATSLPQVTRSSHGYQLIIDGRPTVLLGGQLHNSASSSRSLPELFAKVRRLQATFVIGSASWAVLEPREGEFDLTDVDRQVELAQEHGLRLVLLWFGAYKNASSTYAPTWVRADSHRFPRTELREPGREALSYDGAMAKPVLSVFSAALLDADRTAFTVLMDHLATHDPEHRVVMVQVENEIGVLGDSRDRSPGADLAWAQDVPPALTEYLGRNHDQLVATLRDLWDRHGRQRSGSWSEVFGDSWEAEEVFMAWSFATYAEALAAAGQQVKALPMYVNAWLGPKHEGQQAGEYPSGGPGWRVLDLWKAAAPSLCLLAPDVYEDDIKAAMQPYRRPDNPFFVPESAIRASSAFWAVGELGAIGFSVFGVEDARVDSQLTEAYGVLSGMTAEIAAAQAEGRIRGVLLEDGADATFTLGEFKVVARETRGLLHRLLLDVGVALPPFEVEPRRETEPGAFISTVADHRAFGLVILLDHDTLLLVGQNLTLDASIENGVVEVDTAESGRYVDGRWERDTILNGDERLYLVPMDRIGATRIRLLRR